MVGAIDTNLIVGLFQTSESVSASGRAVSGILGVPLGYPGDGYASYSHTEMFGVRDLLHTVHNLQSRLLYSAYGGHW